MTWRFRQDWVGCSDLLLPPFCCSPETDLKARRRHHQQRKMAMLSFWRDGLERQLAAIVEEHLGSTAGDVGPVNDRLVLRPSNGVLEASDYLSHKHDWVQLDEEVTAPLHRALYVPPNAAVTLANGAGLAHRSASPRPLPTPHSHTPHTYYTAHAPNNFHPPH